MDGDNWTIKTEAQNTGGRIMEPEEELHFESRRKLQFVGWGEVEEDGEETSLISIPSAESFFSREEYLVGLP